MGEGLDGVVVIDCVQKEVCVALSERRVEGAEGGGKLKNLVFVMRLPQTSVMTAHQAWVLGVKTVGPEFANKCCRNRSVFTAAIRSNLIPQLDSLHQSC